MKRAGVLTVLLARVAAADTAPPIFAPPAPSKPTQTPGPSPTPTPTAPTTAAPTTPPSTTAAPTTPPPTTAPTKATDKTTTETPISDKPASDEEEGEPKLSLPTEADRQAWQKPGFRLGLGFAYGELHGLRGAPSGRLIGPLLRVGVRLDADWSILASFQYFGASRSGQLSALRFAGTLDPTWHVTPAFSVSLGLGFGGIVESGPARATDAEPAPDTIETSYTFPDASTPLSSCSGVGVAALARAEYAFVLGPRTELTLAAEAVGQWTGCVDDTGRVEPDTGQAIVRRQWWPHIGGTLSAGVTWR